MRQSIIFLVVTIALPACSDRTITHSTTDSDTHSDAQVVVFRLTDSGTGKPLTNVVVSVYDGFDKSLPPFAGPVRTNNKPYHFSDVKIAADGLLHLDLQRFKKDTILIEAGNLHKYIFHHGNKVKVIHYTREGNALTVNAHYDHDLHLNTVIVTRYPSNKSETPVNFVSIDVPMD